MRWWVRQQNPFLEFQNSILKLSSDNPLELPALLTSFYRKNKLCNSWAVQQQEIKAEWASCDRMGIMGYEMFPAVRKNKTLHHLYLFFLHIKWGALWYRGEMWEKQSNQHCWTRKNVGLVFLWESPCKTSRISLQRSLQNNLVVINTYKHRALNSESPNACSSFHMWEFSHVTQLSVVLAMFCTWISVWFSSCLLFLLSLKFHARLARKEHHFIATLNDARAVWGLWIKSRDWAQNKRLLPAMEKKK